MADAGDALAFLAAHHVVSLALCGVDGPHACSLMYAHDGFTLYWLSDPATRHSRLIDGGGAQGTVAAATIAPDYAEFRQIVGLQLAGRAARLGMVEAARALALLSGRYRFLARLSEGPAALAAAMAKARLYRLVPTTVTLIDNTRSFGSKTSLTPEQIRGAG